MSLADEVRTVKQRVAERLAELEPLAREYEELKRLAGELGLSASQGARAVERTRARTARGSGRSFQQRSGRSATDDRGTKIARTRAARSTKGPAQTHAGAGEEELRARVIEAVRSAPGVSLGEIAKLLEVPATSLYRPVRELTSDGSLVKRARALFPAES
jgi:hypothetical protein